MAPETYYYLLSLIFALTSIMWTVNIILIRTRGSTTFGISYKPGTQEYRNGVKSANNSRIAISTVISVAVIANLLYDVNRLLNFKDHEYAHGLLLYGTIGTFVLFALLIPVGIRQAKIIAGLDKAAKTGRF